MSELTLDNRNLKEVVAYQEARIEALLNRVRELEAIAESRQQHILTLEKICSELQEKLYRAAS